MMKVLIMLVFSVKMMKSAGMKMNKMKIQDVIDGILSQKHGTVGVVMKMVIVKLKKVMSQKMLKNGDN
jgi:hypothetical protein